MRTLERHRRLTCRAPRTCGRSGAGPGPRHAGAGLGVLGRGTGGVHDFQIQCLRGRRPQNGPEALHWGCSAVPREGTVRYLGTGRGRWRRGTVIRSGTAQCDGLLGRWRWHRALCGVLAQGTRRLLEPAKPRAIGRKPQQMGAAGAEAEAFGTCGRLPQTEHLHKFGTGRGLVSDGS